MTFCEAIEYLTNAQFGLGIRLPYWGPGIFLCLDEAAPHHLVQVNSDNLYHQPDIELKEILSNMWEMAYATDGVR